jgi:hypothetical protein
MATIALLLFGGAAAVAGLVGGALVSSVGLLVGPRGLGLCGHGALAAALGAIGCGAYLWATGQVDWDAGRSPGDLSAVIAVFTIGGAMLGYAVSSTAIVGASILRGLGLTDAAMDWCSIAGLIVLAAFALLTSLAPTK